MRSKEKESCKEIKVDNEDQQHVKRSEVKVWPWFYGNVPYAAKELDPAMNP